MYHITTGHLFVYRLQLYVRISWSKVSTRALVSLQYCITSGFFLTAFIDSFVMMHSNQNYIRLSFPRYIAYHCGVPLEAELSAVSFPTFTCFHDRRYIRFILLKGPN